MSGCDASSSSDDDIMLKAFKEATDSQFFSDSLFHDKKEKGDVMNETAALPKSLRRTAESGEFDNQFGVTEDFKNFVAKQLAKSLDRCIQEIHHNNAPESNGRKKCKGDSVGIKLLTNSEVHLSHIEIHENQNSQDNRRQREKLKVQDNSVEHFSKCKEVAVEPDWILSKASTRPWADKRKGTVYKYKKTKDGKLAEMD